MRQLFATFAIVTLFAPALAIASPVWKESTKTQARIEELVANAADAEQTVGQLADLFNLAQPETVMPDVKRPQFANGTPGQLISTDLQLAMTQLSIHIGSNNQIRVLRAQADRHDALVVKDGNFTLRDLAKAAEAQGLDGLRMVGDVARLTRPLVVWLGAGLQFEPGDTLQMDAASGAFLLGFGQIEMIGAEVRASAVQADPESYRPFVLITGQGTLYAQETRFSGLGMVGADPFSGVVVAARGLFPPEFPPTLTDNTFEDLGVVGFIGVNDGLLDGNLIKAGRGGGISLNTVQNIRLSGNAVIGSNGGAGVKLSNGIGVLLAGNLVSGGARNGISVGGNSDGVYIRGNAILANAETGIATQRATCVLVADNSIARNGASGLRLNESGVSSVQGNALVMNKNSGVHVGAQRKGGRIEVSDNLLAGNRVGLTGIAIGDVVLDQNNLSAQMPRLFDGEFSQYLAAYLKQVQQHSGNSYRISGSNGAETGSYLTTCKKV